MSDPLFWLNFAAILAVVSVVFFLLRRVVWWYFGIDQALATLERIDQRLAHILENQITQPLP